MRLWRFCLAGFVYDWLVFVAWTLIPIRAEGLGATPTQLGLLQGASTVAYVLGCMIVGRLADRGFRSLLVVAGCAGATAACLALAHLDTLTKLFLSVGLMGLANAFFWPSVQGAVGAEAEPGRLERAIGLFNVLWSAGKGLGYLMAGGMAETMSHAAVLWIAAASALPILAFFPWAPARRSRRETYAPEGGQTAFLLMGYVANFIGYGVLNTFQSQFFKYLHHTGQGSLLGTKTFFGVFLGIVIAAQTLIFVLLQRGSGWAYRRGLLYGTQALMGAAAGAMVLFRSDLAILSLTPLIGIGAGFVNASSIYYSLHSSHEKGKRAGIHEAILSVGAFVVPLAGGKLADLFDDLRLPYVFAAAAVLAGLLVQEVLYRRSSRS